MVYKANGAGSGTWIQLTDSDLNYSDKTKNRFGWNDISDSLYTSGSPLAISSGVRTKLPNNMLGAQTDTSRLGSLWNSSTNNFLINDLNSVYTLRFNLKAKATAVAGTPYVFTVEVESANGPTVIAGNTHIIKGGSYVNLITSTNLVYIGSFINNQALTFYITPDTNITLYDIGFVIHRSYMEV